jgi:hypothetical protein
MGHSSASPTMRGEGVAVGLVLLGDLPGFLVELTEGDPGR